MARFSDNTTIATIATNDIIPITDISDSTKDKKITMQQVSDFCVTNSNVRTVLGATTTNITALTNLTGVNSGDETLSSIETKLSIDAENLSVVQSLSNSGSATKYLAEDGTYKTIDIESATNPDIIPHGSVSSTLVLTADRYETATVGGALAIGLPTITSTNKLVVCIVKLTQGSTAYAVTHPTVKWRGSVSPVLTTTNTTYTITYWTDDNGSTWYGSWATEG